MFPIDDLWFDDCESFSAQDLRPFALKAVLQEQILTSWFMCIEILLNPYLAITKRENKHKIPRGYKVFCRITDK